MDRIIQAKATTTVYMGITARAEAQVSHSPTLLDLSVSSKFCGTIPQLDFQGRLRR